MSTRRSFMRQKTIYCGNLYREIDIFGYTDNQQQTVKRKKRAKRTKESTPEQKNLNDENSRRFLIQKANLNFGEGDFHVSLTYSDENLPDTVEEAGKMVNNYFKRINYLLKKMGMQSLKYILVTSWNTKGESGSITRIHHHILISCGLDRDTLEDLWRKRPKKGQKKGDPIGFANTDRLQPDKNGIAGISAYLFKQPKGKKACKKLKDGDSCKKPKGKNLWSCSQGLENPWSTPNDSRYTRRQVERIAKERPGREFWEKKYPGWTLVSDDYGVEYTYNDFTGWSIYLKLRKKE